MRNKINISIPKPCHENWQEMTTAEKGRFCNACQKTVYDFTGSSDRQIIEKFNSESNLCGRFLKTQLDRDLRLPKEKNSIWIAGVSGILSFLSLGNQEVFAQEVKTEQTENKSNSEEIADTNFLSDIKINGNVIDNIGILPGTTILNKRTQFKTNSDYDGNFSILAQKGDEIEFSFIGMENKSVIINSKKNIIVIMKPVTNDDQIIMTGEVAVERTFFGRIFHSIGNIFR